MIKFSDIGQGMTFPPKSEATRVGAIRNNRALYNGDYTQLGLTEFNVVTGGGTLVNAAGQRFGGRASTYSEVGINFFRRIANIYPDFLFSEEVLPMTGNARLDEFLAAMDAHLTEALWAANVDAQRFGVAVITTDETQRYLRVIEPDNWFPIVSDSGRLVGDATSVMLTGTHSNSYEVDRPNVVEVSVNDYRSNRRTVVRYEFDNHMLGNVLESAEYDIAPGVRQVALLYNGYSTQMDRGLSAFDDIKPVVRSMIESATGLSGSLVKNCLPYIVGPTLSLLRQHDAPQDADLMSSLRYFGIAGDKPAADQIKYLTFDIAAEGFKFERERNMADLYTLSSLSPILFEVNAHRGDVSGAALKRLLIPFLSRLERIRRSNDEVWAQIITLLNAGRSVTGGEVFDWDPADLEIEWGYKAIFDDATMPSTEEASDG